METWKDEVLEQSFVNIDLIEKLISNENMPSDEEFNKVMEKAGLGKDTLTLEEVAVLLNSSQKERVERIFETAKEIKERVYGHRVVLFAPLYLGNKCMNLCTYCGFKATNTEIDRLTLDLDQIDAEVNTLIGQGHKRLILVYGTHPDYTAEYIAKTVKKTYTVKGENGEIRRVNINAAPMSVEDFKKIGDSGIGTYQIFQETYHEPTYNRVHPKGEKANFKWRLFGLDRAMEAGIDDVGIGALFGLYNWKFEVLGLMSHVRHLEERYGVGPHTISFPRLTEATGIVRHEDYRVKDDELKRIIAILRLAVPYTGLILTARESAKMRRECMDLGVSQIDAGTQIELQGYTKKEKEQDLAREQFTIGDSRSLLEVMQDLMENGFVPSFCTACYRLGRTGEHFMEFSKPGFIHNFCSPNAYLTLAEYLEDYAEEETRETGYKLIKKEVETAPLDERVKKDVIEKLEKIKNGERDLYF
ncbi:[FeFe] hydrogenase H-cluster radical SAM maturase HydG [Sebaldella sp. S0638]|uniref:[FeFe] hydrogenase H-cluster radical SAM maturase HydG n=1 Tax=Sebaldella sp. S0638 TaxID=2957809 RepID=UPI0020A08EF5|nr:[FeFe] hydrogenase H-cluster radical SAM maturase HydG [Sebaldella sp. S0638]MCP1225517.1 [FeFe] hydrogenase H-cluster radical SAM maturase HydG [Sebaldella sp. S0638]